MSVGYKALRAVVVKLAVKWDAVLYKASKASHEEACCKLGCGVV
jgi:hypothetical protein